MTHCALCGQQAALQGLRLLAVNGQPGYSTVDVCPECAAVIAARRQEVREAQP